LALTRKQALLASRSPAAAAALLGLGAFVVAILLAFQLLADRALGARLAHPQSAPVVPLPRCVAGPQSVRPAPHSRAPDAPLVPGCTTLLFAPDTPLVRELMGAVADVTGLVLGDDIVLLPGATAAPYGDLGNSSQWINTTLFNNVDAELVATGQPYPLPTCPSSVGGCADGPAAWQSGDCLPCALAADNRSLSLFLLAHANSTQNAVFVFGAYGNESSYALSYNLSLLGFPLFADSHAQSVKLALDAAMLSRFANFSYRGAHEGSHLVDFRVQLRPFPRPPPRPGGPGVYDVFASNSSQWLFLAGGVAFFLLLTDLVHEKETLLRVSMTQMGLKRSALWAAWASYAALISLASSLLLVLAGSYSGFAFFRYSSPLVTVLLFASFSWAMCCMAAFVSTHLSTVRGAQMVGLGLLLIGFVFQTVVSSSYAGMLDLLYSTTLLLPGAASAPWVLAVRSLLHLYPPFAFAFAFSAISARATASANGEVSGEGAPLLVFSDLYIARDRSFMGSICMPPAPFHFLATLWASAAAFALLAMYCDVVLPGAQGAPGHPLFFLGFRYQKLERSGRITDLPSTAKGGSDAAVPLLMSARSDVDEKLTGKAVDPGVAAEEEAALHGSNLVVRIKRLRVVYRSGLAALFHALTGREWQPLVWLGLPPMSRWVGIRFAFSIAAKTRSRLRSISASGLALVDAPELMPEFTGIAMRTPKPTASAKSGAGDVVAVDGLSLTVRAGEILALLGHNGAGKTTTIGVLTGLISPSEGSAEIVQSSDGAPTIGICPQSDLLWPQLSSCETLRLFASLKGIGLNEQSAFSILSGFSVSNAIDSAVTRALLQVNLSSPSGTQDLPASALSGGMRRRLSIAIAALGDPSLLFLDEPTTGLDPVNRAGVWRLIRSLRQGASIIVTTHSMEEADFLGDRIAIMGGGRLVALGDALALKLRYGDGYRLTLDLFEASASLRARDEVLRLVPGVKVKRTGALRLEVQVPAELADNEGSSSLLVPLIEWCEHASEAASLEVAGSAGAPQRLLKAFSMSAPTLEHAFLRVSALADFDLAKDDGDFCGAVGEGFRACAASPDRGQSLGGALELEASFEAGGQGSLPPVAVPPARGSASLLRRPSIILQRLGAAAGLSTSAVQPSELVVSELGRRRQIGHGFRAIASKTFLLLFRQKGLLACQLLTPVVVLALLVALRLLITAQFGTVSIAHIPPLSLPLNLNLWAPFTSSPSDFDRVIRRSIAAAFITPSALNHSRFARVPHSVNDGSQFRDCVQFFLVGLEPQAISHSTGGRAFPQLIAVNASRLWAAVGRFDRVAQPVGDPGLFPPAWIASARAGVNGSAGGFGGLLSFADASWCRLRNGTLVSSPFFDSRSPAQITLVGSGEEGPLADTPNLLDDELMDDLVALSAVSTGILAVDAQPPCFPGSGLPDSKMSPPSPAPPGYDPASERSSCPAYLVPDASIVFHDAASPLQVDAAEFSPPWLPPFRLSFTMQVNDLPDALLHRPNGLTQQNNFPPGLGFPITIDQGKVAAMDSVFRAFAAWAGLVNPVSGAPIAPPPPATLPAPLFGVPRLVVVTSFPARLVVPLTEVVEIVGAVLYPVTLMLLLPLFLSVAVLEKEQRLVELQLAMGMQWATYAAVTYVVNFVIYCVIAASFWAAAYVLGFVFFVDTSPVLLALTLFAWGLCLCSMNSLLAALLWTREAAVIVGFGCSLLVPLLSVAVAAGIYGVISASTLGTGGMAPQMPVALYLTPLLGPCLALVRILYLGTFHCLMQRKCLDNAAVALSDEVDSGEVRSAVIALFICAALYQALAMYAGAVLPRPHGAPPAHPLFCVPRGARIVACAHMRLAVRKISAALRSPLLEPREVDSSVAVAHAPATDRDDGKDVAAERLRIESVETGPADGTAAAEAAGLALSQRFPIFVRDLRREYSPPLTLSSGLRLLRGGSSPPAKVALAGLSCAVEECVCFGLLGENGSGKTTTLSLLMGLQSASGGDAFVNGFHVEREPAGARRSLGVAPQFDVLWPQLTVGEHLLYFARLKGAAREAEADIVRAALARVGLAHLANRRACALSGGMRRRVSLAIALVGSSRVVILDEPSTGLDPASRRRLWRLVEDARRGGEAARGRAMVLVSHDMAEVEALCSRVGVMSRGRLRCIGSPDELRARFAGGFALSVRHDARVSAAECAAAVVELVPGAERCDDGLAACVVALSLPPPPRGLRLSQVFAAMAVLKARGGCVVEWSVARKGLEEVLWALREPDSQPSAQLPAQTTTF